MIKNFSDYQVYLINEDSPAPKEGLIIITSAILSDEHKGKLEQILKSVGHVYNDEFVFTEKVTSPSDILNSLEAKKVNKAIIFSNELTEEIQPYAITPIEPYSFLIANNIETLIEDEKKGITERRKALWVALKSWL